jgi:hypothetical protein
VIASNRHIRRPCAIPAASRAGQPSSVSGLATVAEMLEKPSHTGAVVPDLAGTVARLSEERGLKWTPIIERTYRVRSAHAVALVPFRFAYSLDEPFLELIEAMPGTIWETSQPDDVHHVGYWVEDLAAESARLLELGMPVEVCGLDESGTLWGFAYHRSPDGSLHELVDARFRRKAREVVASRR